MKPKPLITGREIRVGVAVLWFMLVVLAYYAVQKPLAAAQLAALVRLTVLLGGWLACIALANLIGRVPGRALAASRAETSLALRIGFGLGVISLALLVFAALGLITRAVLWAVVLVPLPASLPALIRDLRSLKLKPGRDRWLLVFVVFALGTAGLRALAPPTAWDSLVYHLTGPELYLRSGGLVHQIDLPYLGFPKVGSMLFLLGMGLAGPELAQLLHLTFAGLTLLLLPEMVGRAAPGRGALAAGLLMAVPSLWLLAGWAYVEWAAACYLVASFLLAGDPPDEDPPATMPRSRLVVAGYFAGMALGTKYSVAWAVLALSILLAVRVRDLRRIGTFALSAAVFAAPSLLANLALTGNPTYPFFFEGLMWDAHRAAWYSRLGTGLDLRTLLLAPWEATVYGLEGGYFEGHASFGATIGPLLLGLIPLLFLRSGRHDRQTRDMLILVAVAGAGWVAQLASSQLLVQTRLLFPIFPFLAALAAIGFEALGDISLRARFVLGGLIVFILAATSAGYLVQVVQDQPLRVALGLDSRTQNLRERLGAHMDAMEAVNQLPDGSTIYFLWEPRSYYCAPTVVCEPDAMLDRWWHARQHASDPSKILTTWKQAGATHILYRRVGAEAVRAAGFDPIRLADWEALDLMLGELLIPLQEVEGGFSLYRIP